MNPLTLFYVEDSNLTIISTVFLNFNLSSPLLIFSNDYDFEFILQNCIFDSILLFSVSATNFIYIKKSNGNVIFQNSTFRKLSFFDSLLFLENVSGTININFMLFEQNEIFSQILNIEESINIIINNTICNFTNNKNGVLYTAAGGGFRIYNTLYKTIMNLEMSYSFSVITCFGIKIIDDSSRNISNYTDFLVQFFFLFLLRRVKLFLDHN